MDYRSFAVGWFLSVAWLMLAVHLSSKLDDERDVQKIQTLMVAIWVIVGVAMFLRPAILPFD